MELPHGFLAWLLGQSPERPPSPRRQELQEYIEFPEGFVDVLFQGPQRERMGTYIRDNATNPDAWFYQKRDVGGGTYGRNLSPHVLRHNPDFVADTLVPLFGRPDRLVEASRYAPRGGAFTPRRRRYSDPDDTTSGMAVDLASYMVVPRAESIGGKEQQRHALSSLFADRSLRGEPEGEIQINEQAWSNLLGSPRFVNRNSERGYLRSSYRDIMARSVDFLSDTRTTAARDLRDEFNTFMSASHRGFRPGLGQETPVSPRNQRLAKAALLSRLIDSDVFMHHPRRGFLRRLVRDELDKAQNR